MKVREDSWPLAEGLGFDVHMESLEYASCFLRRNVRLDCYLPDPVADPSTLRLLLVNDGQDLEAMGFSEMLKSLAEEGAIEPLLCVGIHAGRDRLQEYGTAIGPDYKGRGSKAFLYTHFIVKELLPFLKREFCIPFFAETAFAGFSLGGLSAMDIVWNHPGIFSKAGVFSGSLWWRSRAYSDGYSESTDRIMHAQVRNRQPGPLQGGTQRYFFECGTGDETADRNGNGVIDSIDDTLELIAALKEKGLPDHSIHYLEVPGGRHDRATWASAMPQFIRWGWGRSDDI